VIRLTHTSPRRTLTHLRKLQREGESLLARPDQLSPHEEAPWDVRVWRCLDRLAAPGTFDGALILDRADVGLPDLTDFDRPTPSATDRDQRLRRRIGRRLVTLASVIEKVEALCEPPPS